MAAPKNKCGLAASQMNSKVHLIASRQTAAECKSTEPSSNHTRRQMQLWSLLTTAHQDCQTEGHSSQQHHMHGELQTTCGAGRSLLPTPNCPLCSSHQTLLHVLSHCPVALQNRGYNQRHDAVLEQLHQFANSHANPEQQVTVGLPNREYFFPASFAVTDSRPDMIIWSQSSIQHQHHVLFCPSCHPLDSWLPSVCLVNMFFYPHHLSSIIITSTCYSSFYATTCYFDSVKCFLCHLLMKVADDCY